MLLVCGNCGLEKHDGTYMTLDENAAPLNSFNKFHIPLDMKFETKLINFHHGWFKIVELI